MLKKSLIILSIFSIVLFTSSMCFATGLVQGTENVLERAGQGIGNMVDDTTDAFRNTSNGMTGTMDKMTNDDSSNNGSTMTSDNMSNTGANTGTGYTASRTATTNNTNGTGAGFVWVILAIVAIAIIGLVWYYAAQTDNRNSNH